MVYWAYSGLPDYFLFGSACGNIGHELTTPHQREKGFGFLCFYLRYGTAAACTTSRYIFRSISTGKNCKVDGSVQKSRDLALVDFPGSSSCFSCVSARPVDTWPAYALCFESDNDTRNSSLWLSPALQTRIGKKRATVAKSEYERQPWATAHACHSFTRVMLRRFVSTFMNVFPKSALAAGINSLCKR